MQFNCAYTELVTLNKLIPNPKNPNKHSGEQVERLAKIIDFQGQRLPIVVSKRSGFITKGHGRLMALKKLGWEQAAVDYQEYVSEAQEYADIVADNEIARWAEVDSYQILTDLKELELGDIELLGFKDSDFLTNLVVPDLLEDGTNDHLGNPQGTKVVTLILTEEENDKFMDSFEANRQEEETVKDFVLRKSCESAE